MTSTEHAAVIRQRKSPENAAVADRTGRTVRDLITRTPAKTCRDPERRAEVDPDVPWTREPQQARLSEAGRA